MDELTLTAVGDDDIDDLVAIIHDGFDAIPLPDGVEPYRSIPFAFALRSGQGDIIGGVTGHTVWGWLYVRYLWVTEARRGQRLGKHLLEAAEGEARARGCRGVWLHTMSFQAAAFYEHMGYERCGEIDGIPEGHKRIFYQKRLKS